MAKFPVSEKVLQKAVGFVWKVPGSETAEIGNMKGISVAEKT